MSSRSMGGGIQQVVDIFYVVALLVKIRSRVCSWGWVDEVSYT